MVGMRIHFVATCVAGIIRKSPLVPQKVPSHLSKLTIGSTGPTEQDTVEWTASMFMTRTILFDGACGFCKRTARLVKWLDWLGKVDAQDFISNWPQLQARYP